MKKRLSFLVAVALLLSFGGVAFAEGIYGGDPGISSNSDGGVPGANSDDDDSTNFKNMPFYFDRDMSAFYRFLNETGIDAKAAGYEYKIEYRGMLAWADN